MSQKTIISIKRLVPALIIGPASWLGPYIVMLGLFLPALLQELDSENKVAMLAMFAATGSIISAIETEPGYPPVVRMGSNGLKITKSDFKDKLQELIDSGKVA